MKRIIAMAVFVLLTVGCASSITSQREMFCAPNFNSADEKPEKLLNILFTLPHKLDVTDSAFFYELGIEPISYSWKAVEWKENQEKEKWESAELKAVRLEEKGTMPKLIITAVGGWEQHTGNPIAVADHSGTRLYNQQGRLLKVPQGWRKVNPDDYPDFFTVISEKNSAEVINGTSEYEAIMTFYKLFTVIEIMQMRDSVYVKHGIPLGTKLTEKQLKRIENDKSVEKIKEFLFDNWYVMFTYPLLSPSDYGVFILISKVFQIPSIWWKDDLNKPGYMDRALTAGDAFDIMEYYQQRYATTNRLPDDLREQIKADTGRDFATYREYNLWISKQNSQN